MDVVMCKEAAFILGATDGDIVSAARRLVKILRVYQWAVEQLAILVDCSSDEQLIQKKEEILSEVRKDVLVGADTNACKM